MTHILGFGGYVPERVMTNDDWAKLVDTSDEWISRRTGIKRRRIAADDESTLTLAANAAGMAIKDAGLTPDDIDEIIVATDTPEMYTPDTAALLQDLLGCRNIPTYDLGGSGCAGFVQALDVARARISYSPKKVLVVGVELITRLIDWTDRSTAVLFGDGAGAVVLGPEMGRARILDVITGTDGSAAGILTLAAGGTRNPFNRRTLESGEYNRLVMDGRRVFTEAVNRMSGAVDEVLQRIGSTIGDVALVIPHQANLRIIEGVGKKLGVEQGRVYVNVHEYGNTGSATVPFAMWEGVETGRIRERRPGGADRFRRRVPLGSRGAPVLSSHDPVMAISAHDPERPARERRHGQAPVSRRGLAGFREALDCSPPPLQDVAPGGRSSIPPTAWIHQFRRGGNRG